MVTITEILPSLGDIDRSAVANARIEGLTTDLHMSMRPVILDKIRKLTLYTAGNQYLTGLTLYFIGYVLFEVSYHEHLLLIADPKRFRAISFSS